MILPAISLWQPYASALVFAGPGRRLKRHETRHFRLPPRHLAKRVAIHAAGRAPPSGLSEGIASVLVESFGHDWRRTLPRGAIVGTVLMRSCRPMCPGDGSDDLVALPEDELDEMFGDWTPGRYAWRADEPVAFEKPIPCAGRQSWFTVDIPEAA